MTKHIRCCDCRCELLSCDSNAETKLVLCSDCWRKTPSARIVERSRQHDASGHAQDRP